MKVLIQRVCNASVSINNEVVGAIGDGLLVFLGVQHADCLAVTDKMVERLLAYRVFADSQGKMNLSVTDIGGEVLVVSQFTLAADTRKGLRPSFSSAAPPALAEQLYEYFVAGISQRGVQVATGQFGADMQVSLVNDGPVTFLLEL